MNETVLEIKNLKANVEDKEILKGIDLTVKSGEIHALMGPNGAGKSTLGEVLIGHPNYKIISGKILINNKDMTYAAPEDRAKAGLFLAFQSPISISGVKIVRHNCIFYELAKNNKDLVCSIRGKINDR